MTHRDVKEFFLIEGESIVTLKLGQLDISVDPSVIEKAFKDLLECQTPNLINLDCSTCSYVWRYAEKPTISIPNLQTFSGDYPKGNISSDATLHSTAYKVMRGAPNLKEVHGFDLNSLDFLVTIGKLHLVKEIEMDNFIGKNDTEWESWRSNDQFFKETFVRIASANPNLKR